MFRFLFRAFGFVLLAAAAMYAVIDGTKSIASNSLVFTSFADSWRAVHYSSLANLRKYLEATASFLWDPLMLLALSAPTFLVFLILALILLWLGQIRRRPYF